MTVAEVVEKVREEFPTSEVKLCGEECDIKRCSFEPCHCPYGIQRQAEAMEFLFDQYKEGKIEHR